MKMIIKSNEISKVARILANNNFTDVKNIDKLTRYLHISISNYYILSVQKNFAPYLKYSKDFNSWNNYFKILIDYYNFLFNENIEIKKEDIEITIIGEADDDK